MAAPWERLLRWLLLLLRVLPLPVLPSHLCDNLVDIDYAVPLRLLRLLRPPPASKPRRLHSGTVFVEVCTWQCRSPACNI